MSMISLESYEDILKTTKTVNVYGYVTRVIGTIVESKGPDIGIGSLCYLKLKESGKRVAAEVVGFRDNRVLLMPLGEIEGISPGTEVVSASKPLSVNISNSLLGRVLDGLGNPIDGKGPVLHARGFPIHRTPPPSLSRRRIVEPMGLGIRAIDGLMTCGRGQKLGVFAGSGVGKSVLMGMMAKRSEADVNVVVLLGERGREVREFLERDLGEEGLRRSVVVVVTSDQAPLLKIKGAMTGMTIAEFFRTQGKDVVLMMDSLTRFAMAQREIGLAAGEPPTAKGYTPSVFSLLPKLLERAGTAAQGSITALLTVLVEADDFNEPISDAVRAILDGHIVLSRKMAAMNHYPAIDVLDSISRLMNDIVPEGHKIAAAKMREVLATYREAEDLINIGAYVKGSNKRIDYALLMINKVNKFLRQGINEACDSRTTQAELLNLFK